MSGHGGDVRRAAAQSARPIEDILDFSANINPLGPPEWLRPAVSRVLEHVVHYPEPHGASLCAALARRHAVAPEEVVVGNGASELIFALPRVMGRRRAVTPSPCYVDYAHASRAAGLAVHTPLLREEDQLQLDPGRLGADLRPGDLVFIGQPNNPTGLPVDPDALRGLAKQFPACMFVIDEAFAGFVDGLHSVVRDRPTNVVVLRSMTKLFAIPGLRLGYAVCDVSVAQRLRDALPPWSVNSVALAVGERAAEDVEYVARTVRFVDERRAELARDLAAIGGLAVYPSRANFLLVRVNRSAATGPALADALLEDGIAIRVCADYAGLDDRFVRVAVRTRDENARLCRALARALGAPRAPAPRRPTPAVMLQGTSSNAGKSVLATALCRVLLQDGFSVAPFKAQNMSLNSFVTRDGGEMGRAQVTQAQACRLEPDVRMNPVLLKPSTDVDSQVIVLGRPDAGCTAMDYGQRAERLFAVVADAYDGLAAEHDVMVLEGAGSPGEVNLKQRDIVNMRMASHAQAPVLLVGDIDRGGVFASFVGHMEVFAEWERRLVAGFIVNRFRGDAALLGDALDDTHARTGRPVLGVVPYLEALGLPDEDSVEFKAGAFGKDAPPADGVTIAVVDLPHISNFTDFDALGVEPDVGLRVAKRPADLEGADAILLPGSKNTIHDLAALQATGMAEELRRIAARGDVEIVGLCAGFQMLGRRVADPDRVESAEARVAGLGLLPVATELAPEKVLRQTDARHVASGLDVRGYEIHHGRTETAGLPAAVVGERGGVLGVASTDGLVWGTYLHGLFDADAFRRWFVDGLRRRRGLAPLGGVTAAYDLEPALDRLAEAVRASVDMAAVYRILGLA